MGADRNRKLAKTSEHDYDLAALQEACGDSDLEGMDIASAKEPKENATHMPMKSSKPKK